MLASIYLFNCVLFARFHFSRSPHSLRDFIYFLKKRRGSFNIVHCIFEKTSLQIAAEWQKNKNANWKCVGPQLPGISNTFYAFSTLLFIISTCNIEV